MWHSSPAPAPPTGHAPAGQRSRLAHSKAAHPQLDDQLDGSGQVSHLHHEHHTGWKREGHRHATLPAGGLQPSGHWAAPRASQHSPGPESARQQAKGVPALSRPRQEPSGGPSWPSCQRLEPCQSGTPTPLTGCRGTYSRRVQLLAGSQQPIDGHSRPHAVRIQTQHRTHALVIPKVHDPSLLWVQLGEALSDQTRIAGPTLRHGSRGQPLPTLRPVHALWQPQPGLGLQAQPQAQPPATPTGVLR